MALSESISVLATIKGIDLVSSVLGKISESFGATADAAETAASAAETAGASIDTSLLQTASGADALDLANTRATSSQIKLAEATRAQAAAEQQLLSMRDAIATEDQLIDSANRLAVAQQNAAVSAKELAKAQEVVNVFKEEKVSADLLDAAMQNLARAQQAATATARELSAAQKESNDLIRQSDVAAAADRLTKAEKGVAAASKDAAASQERLRITQLQAAAAAGDAAAKEELAAGANAKNAESATKSAEANTKNAESSTRAKNAAAMGALAIAAIGYESIKSAVSFQTLTTRLVTTAGESQSKLKMVQDGIIGISNQTGISADDLAKAMYIVESGGYHGAEGLAVLRAAEEGAATEGANFTDVANAVSNIMTAYSLHGKDAANVTSQLTAAVSVGKATFQTMSTAMGTVLPTAAAMHLKFNDVAGVLAEMTAQGIPALRASQNLANAMRSLEKPSATMVKEFKAMGISTDDLSKHLATQGLGGTLQWLSKEAAANASKLHQTYGGALGALMGTAAGLNVALTTTGKHARDTAKNIATIGKASADAKGNVLGFAELQKTTAFQFDKAKQAIINTGIAIGSILLPVVTQIAGKIQSVVMPIAQWVQKHQQLVATIFKVVAGLIGLILVVKGVVAVVEMVQGAFELLAANPVVAAIVILTAILVYCYFHFKAFRQIVNEVASFLKTVFVDAWHLAVEAVKALAPVWDEMVKLVQEAVKWFNDNVLSWLKARMADFSNWWHQNSKQILQIWNVIWNLIKLAVHIWWDGSMKPTLNVIESVWKTVWTAIKDTVKLVWSAISGVVTTAIHLIMNIISVVLDLITGNWGKFLKDLWKLVSQGFWDVVHTISNIMSGVGKLLWDAGVNIIKGLIGGIKSMFGAIGNVMSDVGHTIRSFFPFSPAKRGPLSGSGSPNIAGKKIGTMVAQGLEESVPQLEKSTATAMQAAARGLKSNQSLKVAASSMLTVGGGFTALGGGGVGVTGAPVQIHLDVHDNTIMNDRDVDFLIKRIEKRLATVTLPSGGYRSKF